MKMYKCADWINAVAIYFRFTCNTYFLQILHIFKIIFRIWLAWKFIFFLSTHCSFIWVLNLRYILHSILSEFPAYYLYFTPTWFKILITFLGYLDSVNSKLGKSFRTEFNPGTTNLTITEVSRISIQFHPSGRSQRCIVCHTPLLFQYPWFHCNYFLFLLLINLTNRIRKIIILYLISSMNLCANHSLLG